MTRRRREGDVLFCFFAITFFFCLEERRRSHLSLSRFASLCIYTDIYAVFFCVDGFKSCKYTHSSSSIVHIHLEKQKNSRLIDTSVLHCFLSLKAVATAAHKEGGNYYTFYQTNIKFVA